MDPGQYLVEALLRALEVVLAKERERTRLMKKSLRAGQAKLKAKERERSMLKTEKDRVLAFQEEVEKLVADFLEADGKKNFDDQKAMINSGGGDGSKGGGFDGVYGRGTINYLENSQNLEEKALIATVKGTNSNGNGSSHGGGNGSCSGSGKGGGFDGVDGGGINDLENAQNLDEKAVIPTVKGTNSDGNGSSHGGGGSGGYGSCSGSGKGGGFDGVDGGGINDPENAQNLDEEAVIPTVKGTNSDGNGSSHGSGGSGGYGV